MSLKMEIIGEEKANKLINEGGIYFILFRGDTFNYCDWYEWRGVELSESEIRQAILCSKCLVEGQALIVDYEE